MHFDLTDEQTAIRRLARDFAEGEVKPVAEELDRDKRFPYEIVAAMGKLGLMGVPYPEQYGGGGADNLSYALVIEELARVDSSVGITVAANTSLGTWPVYAFGSEDQKARLMPALCAGTALGAFGLTEPEAGSDAGNARTTATLDGGEWVIALGRIKGRGRRTGVAFDARAGWVARFRDGLVTSFHTYADSQEALEAVGLRE